MQRKGQKRTWSITTHFIVPLFCFALGLMVSTATMGSHDHGDPSATAPGTQMRLVELMGQVNDLESTNSDLERRLADAQQARDHLESELTDTKAQLKTAKAEAKNAVQSVGSADAKEDWSKEVEEEAAWAAQVKLQGKSAAQWSKLGKFSTASLEPLSFLKEFDIGLPTETIKWSGGFLMIPKAAPDGGGSILDHVQHQCSELDVRAAL